MTNDYCTGSLGCQEQPLRLSVGEGEAIGFKKKTGKLKICQEGKIKVKKEKLVKFLIACNGMYFLNLSE